MVSAPQEVRLWRRKDRGRQGGETGGEILIGGGAAHDCLLAADDDVVMTVAVAFVIVMTGS